MHIVLFSSVIVNVKCYQLECFVSHNWTKISFLSFLPSLPAPPSRPPPSPPATSFQFHGAKTPPPCCLGDHVPNLNPASEMFLTLSLVQRGGHHEEATDKWQLGRLAGFKQTVWGPRGFDQPRGWPVAALIGDWPILDSPPEPGLLSRPAPSLQEKEIERRDRASFFQYLIFIRFEAVLCCGLNWFFCSAWNLPRSLLSRTRGAWGRRKLDLWDPCSRTGVKEGLGDRWLTSCRARPSLWMVGEGRALSPVDTQEGWEDGGGCGAPSSALLLGRAPLLLWDAK